MSTFKYVHGAHRLICVPALGNQLWEMDYLLHIRLVLSSSPKTLVFLRGYLIKVPKCGDTLPLCAVTGDI